jgi:hypothetical protein
MKWWYGLVILVGVILGLMVFSKNIKNNKGTLTLVNETELQSEVAKMPTIVTTSKEGAAVNTRQLTEIVEPWSPEKGLIEVKAAGKIWQFYLVPAKPLHR